MSLIVAGQAIERLGKGSTSQDEQRTVKNHITHILKQLSVRDRTQAAVFANAFLPLLERLK
ncbi:response regulator transcription factor [Microcoleus sp. FACHB-1515]|nr:response regulator transcription factor [Microcoleus sp. FACHB-1515]